MSSGDDMGKQDELRDDPLAPVVIQALTDLARLAQQASSVAVDAQERFTGLLLERLLALCAAQCGALSLTSRDKLPPVSEQEHVPAFFAAGGLRTLALRNMSEERAHTLLAVASDGEALVQDIPAASYWLAFHFPPTHAFSPHLWAEFSLPETPAVSAEHNVQIVLLLGWTGLQIEQSVGVVEKARSLLSRVADSVETVMQNLLLAERVHELEAAIERGTLREMELLKAE